MELRAFSVCRSCYEVHVARAECPYCAGAAAVVEAPPAPPLSARGSLAAEEAFEDTVAIQPEPRWTPIVAIASAAVVVSLLLATVIHSA
jgi:hypothetical protein